MSDDSIVFCYFAVLEGSGVMVFEFDRGHGVHVQKRNRQFRSRKPPRLDYTATPRLFSFPTSYLLIIHNQLYEKNRIE
jgi:hypothetical protein